MARQTGDTKKNIVKKVKPGDKKKIDKPIEKKKIYNNKLQKRTVTHDGHKITAKQMKFIDKYVETGNGSQSVIDAGYTQKNTRQYAQYLLTNPYIAEEIAWRLEQHRKDSIATADEVFQFYTKVMRGEEKDQFGLEAPLSERIKAGNELAKRLIDIPNKLEATINGKSDSGQATVTIALNWDGMGETNNDNQNEESHNDTEK